MSAGPRDLTSSSAPTGGPGAASPSVYILSQGGYGWAQCVGICSPQSSLSLVPVDAVPSGILIVFVEDNQVALGGPPTVTDSLSPATTFQLRASVPLPSFTGAPGPTEYEFWGEPIVSILTSDTISVGFGTTYLSNDSAIVFSVTGENPLDPFDPAVPATATGSGSYPGIASASVTIRNPDDLILGAAATWLNTGSLSATPGYGTGYYPEAVSGAGVTGGFAEGETAVGTYHVGGVLSGTATTLWGFITDALQQNNTTRPCCTVAANPTVQDRPGGEAYDSGTHQIFVTNWGSATVSALADTSPYAASWAPTPVGSRPNGPAYDSATGCVWVAIWSSNEIQEIADSSGKCGTPGTVVTTVPLPANTSGPYGITYDPTDEVMLVSDEGYGPQIPQVIVICASALPVCTGATPPMEVLPLSATPTTTGPVQSTWDPAANAFFVSNPSGPEVDVIACTPHLPSCATPGTNWGRGAPAIALPAGSVPHGLVYASSTRQVFVADSANNVLWVINDGTRHPLGLDPLFPAGLPLLHGTTPADVAYNAVCNELFVTQFASSEVVVLSAVYNVYPTIGLLQVGAGPLSAVYDPSSTYLGVPGAVFVANYGQNAAINGNGNLSVIYCAFCNQTVTPCNYTITFNETGLLLSSSGTGPTWDITLDGVTMSATVSTTGGMTITFSGLCAGNYSYTVSTPTGYTASPSSGTITIPASLAPGSEVYQPITFTPVPPCNYTITFIEAGLPAGTLWSVTVNGMTVASATNTLTFYGLCAGTYTFIVNAPPGFMAAPPAGTVTIPASLAPGSEVYQKVVFSPICNYTVTFNETGLPTGSRWSVTLNGTTLSATVTTTGGHSITFSGLCAGSYAFRVTAPRGYTANPSSGTVVIPVGLPAGSEVYQTIAFQNLEFTETGLPAGSSWDVTIVGRGVHETNTTNGTLISFSVPRGTYRYTISKPCEYKATPLSGSVTVRTSVVVVHVVFTLLTKVVKFKETGLPHGTSWSVNVTGPEPFAPFTIVTTTYASTTPTISVTTVCGNYSWNASNVVVGHTTYVPHPATGTFTITVTGNTIRKVPPANPIAIRYI